MEITEGYMPFKDFKTYYRVVGKRCEGKAPVVLLHGGPGSTHNYFELLDELAATGHQLIMYDQTGCGMSYVEGHPELFTLDSWLDELEALRSYLDLGEMHVLGQSWGGMMILAWLIDRQPKGVHTAILSSTLPSSRLWSHEQHRLISFMPEAEQQAIRRAEATGNYADEAYVAANDHYTELHACSIDERSLECLQRKKKFGTESYNVAWGPNEYTPTGNLKDFDYTQRLGEIKQPCLIISGTNDECTPLVAKTMADGIANSRWELLPDARHMTFADDTEGYINVLKQWLAIHP